MSVGTPRFPTPDDPTSTLTFEDLILVVAREAGWAYYGENGDEEAQVPVDKGTLSDCKRIVNDAIRMFLADAPPTGWRWARPVAQIAVWGTIGASASNLSSAVQDGERVVVTVQEDTFLPSMELKAMVVTTVGTVMIRRVLSRTQAEIDLNGLAVWTSQQFSIASDGNFTLPRTFAGIVTGGITYLAGSDQGTPIAWVDERKIRQQRENVTDESGDPYWAAVRMMDVDGLNRPIRRRWELMTYPNADDFQTFEFPFELHFDELVFPDETPPCPFVHDEAIRSACLAVVERDVYDKPGRHYTEYNEKRLPQSYSLDARSGPRRLGYFGNPGGLVRDINFWRANMYDRPTVVYNTP